MTRKTRLYEVDDIWAQPMQLGQRRLLQAFLDFWPDGVQRVLDVGCGDGKLTHALAEATGACITGLDSSAEALTRLKLPYVVASADAVPFSDASFDLVITSDVLEHLPDTVESDAWTELFRLSSKWLMVAVPFREELLDATTRCPVCTSLYHVNWHQRCYDLPDLFQRAPTGWSVRATVLSGEPWSAMTPLETRFRRHVLNEWSGWDKAICPHCGAPGVTADVPQQMPTLAAIALGDLVYQALRLRRVWRSHSEVLVIFEKGESLARFPNASCEVISQLATEANLTWKNSTGDLVPYPQIARCVGSGSKLLFQFPLYEDDPELIVVREKMLHEPIYIRVEDGAGFVFSGEVLAAGQTRACLRFERQLTPGYYGVLISAPFDVQLSSVQLGRGPPVEWLQPIGNQGSTYHVVPFGPQQVHVQVCSTLWIDPDLGQLDSGVSTTPHFSELLERMELRAKEWRQAYGQISAVQEDLRTQCAINEQQAIALQNIIADRDALLGRTVELSKQVVLLQNLQAEHAVLLQRLAAAEQLEVVHQNLVAEREILLRRVMVGDRQSVQLQNLQAEHAALTQRLAATEQLEVERQNLLAERELLQQRVVEGDKHAVQLQNLKAEHAALTQRLAAAEQLEVEHQNLLAERALLQQRVIEGDRQAVQLQNLQAEHAVLMRRVIDGERQVVQLQNLQAEHLILKQRLVEAERIEVECQNLRSERDALLISLRDAERQTVTLQNVVAERDALLLRAAEADRTAVLLQNLQAQFDVISRCLSEERQQAQKVPVLSQQIAVAESSVQRLLAEVSLLQENLAEISGRFETRIGSVVRISLRRNPRSQKPGRG